MIAKSYIQANLNSIGRKYNADNVSNKDALMFSKLAVMELCGWIEESMDDIVLRCANRTVKKSENKDAYREKVKAVYGFEYEKHFRFMLIQLIGLVDIEKIEKNMGEADVEQFRQLLKTLKGQRNKLAHTHLKRKYPIQVFSPSRTISEFEKVYIYLVRYQEALK